MRISNFFFLDEFLKSDTADKHGLDLRKCLSSEITENLVELVLSVLEPARERYGHPIIVTSGFRPVELNRLVGSKDTSDHVVGQAADLTSADNERLWTVLKELPFKQLIRYENYDGSYPLWIHVAFEKGCKMHEKLLCVISDTGAKTYAPTNK